MQHEFIAQAIVGYADRKKRSKEEFKKNMPTWRKALTEIEYIECLIDCEIIILKESSAMNTRLLVMIELITRLN